MRRLAVALVVVAAVGVLPDAAASASAASPGAAAESLFSDFNSDGFADLAVGVPGESIESTVNAGAVNVLYGGAAGLSGSGSQMFTQNTPGVGSAGEEFDLFGDALAAADFNNDGFADLAVGVPGESSSITAVGAVNVLYGSAAGLTGTGSQMFTQNTSGVGSTAEEADFFGDALTAGDFDNDGFADLAVGVPGESVGSLINAGAVNVLYGSAAGLTGSGSQTLTQNSVEVGSAAERNDSFGFALGAGDFDGDGFDDLGVGVPFEASSVPAVGAVNVLYGSAGGLIGSGSQFFTQNSPGLGSSSVAEEQFGFALGTGDFDGDGFADLGIGVPVESSTVLTAGAVNVLYGSAAGLTGSGSQFFTQDSAGVGSAAEPDDALGLALTAADFDNDGFADLAIGAPGEASNIPAVGAVNVLYGSAAGLSGSGSQLFTQNSAGLGPGEPDDSFGFTLAAGDFDADGFADLTVGVPFESAGSITGSGEVDVVYGSGAGLSSTGSQSFTQDTPGVASAAEEFDLFGFALAAAPDGQIALAGLTARSATSLSSLLPASRTGR